MEEVNRTQVKEFILKAFSDFHQLQILLFVVVLLTYVTCIFGNTVIIILVRIEHSLHTPMYFFISIFALLEVIFVSVTVPKLLANLVTANNKISFAGCFAQLYAFNSLGVTECYLLAAMVFDRHLAINKPLRYSAIMSQSFCTLLAIIPWLIGFLVVLIPTIITTQLEFCGPNELNHFFCDLGPLQKLSCSDPFPSIVSTSSAAVFDVVVPFIIILGLYGHIILTVTKIKSDVGKKKAFSTCSSHIIVAGLFYGTAIIVYVRPKGSQHDRFLALMYTIITPVINPFIYTLRNRDIRAVLRKTIRLLQKPFLV